MKRIPPTLDPEQKPPDIVVPPRPRRRPRPRPLRVLLFAIVGFLVTVHAMIVALRWVPLPTSAFMLASPTKPVRHQWTPRAGLPEVARLAVVAAEDQKFFEHAGFDIEAIGKALEQNKRGGRVRGASTISQQTAKNVFLWEGRSWVRKGLEAWLTLVIEWTWGKERILDVYLNVAEFGPGIYGVEAAAQAYFKKPAARLTAREAARLAAVLPSPRKWKVLEPGPYVQSRTEWILRQMGHAPAPEPEPEPEFDAVPGIPGGIAPETVAPAEDGGAAAEPEPEAWSEPETTPYPPADSTPAGDEGEGSALTEESQPVGDR